MSVQTQYKTMLDKQGINVTYKQVTGQSLNATTLKKTNTFTNVAIKAHFRKFSQKEISGLIKEGDRQIRIAANSITFIPKTNDRITTTDGEFNVVVVDKRTSNGSDTLFICVVRGVDQ